MKKDYLQCKPIIEDSHFSWALWQPVVCFTGGSQVSENKQKIVTVGSCS